MWMRRLEKDTTEWDEEKEKDEGEEDENNGHAKEEIGLGS